MEVVLPIAAGERVEATKDWFVGLGFALLSIVPADDPRECVLRGHGCKLRLLRGSDAPAPRLRLACDAVGGGPRILTAPNGTVVEVVAELEPPLPLPPLEEALFVSRLRAHGEEQDVVGRAGMVYRDLLPTRLGGRFIASHIRIPEAGPVPDMCHFHICRFQMIFCVAGAVRLVYEDQGEPFWLRVGDCVLQPPGIRHRVLESSAGLEVLEISSPAEHLTMQDLSMELPTVAAARSDREWPQEYDGAPQRFVRHDASSPHVAWTPHEGLLSGWERRDTGIARATKGLASCVVWRCREEDRTSSPSTGGVLRRDAELVFRYVLRGQCELRVNHDEASAGHRATTERLCRGDSLVVPAGMGVQLLSHTDDCEFVEVLCGFLN